MFDGGDSPDGTFLTSYYLTLFVFDIDLDKDIDENKSFVSKPISSEQSSIEEDKNSGSDTVQRAATDPQIVNLVFFNQLLGRN